MGVESNHGNKRQSKRMVQRSDSGSADRSVDSSSVGESVASSSERKTRNSSQSSLRSSRSLRSSAREDSWTEKSTEERRKSPGRRRIDLETSKHEGSIAGESVRENSARSNRTNPLKLSRGSNRRSSDSDGGAFEASFHGCERQSSLEGTQTKGETKGINRRSSDSDLGVLADALDGSGEESPVQSPPDRPRGVPSRSQSSDEVLASSSVRRSRRPTNRNLASSRHSVESLGSATASESMISGTEHSSESTPSQRGRLYRVRSERKGRESGEEGVHRSSLLISSPAPNGRSVSTGRMSTRGPATEPLSANERGKTPTKSRRGPKTESERKVIAPEEIFGAALRARAAAASPQGNSKPAVGMARVKELSKKKTRSSSAPRAERSTDRNHASFCGSLEQLNKLRKLKKPATDDDLVSVDQSVQTWDPSNARKSRTMAKHNHVSGASSGSKSTHTRRQQKVVRRKVPAN